MNPIVYIGLKNSEGCVCGSSYWARGQEFINPRMNYNVLTVDALNGINNLQKRLDCYHVHGTSRYSYVNLIFKFKNGEERQYDLTKKQQLTECLQMMEEYIANGNNLEAPSKFEVANEIEFMDI